MAIFRNKQSLIMMHVLQDRHTQLWGLSVIYLWFVCKNPRNLIRFQTHGVLHNIPSAKALTYSHYEEIIAIKHLVSSTPILGSIISKYNSSHINTPVVILFWIVSTFCGTLVIASLLSVVYPWLRHYFPWSSLSVSLLSVVHSWLRHYFSRCPRDCHYVPWCSRGYVTTFQCWW